MDELMTEGQIPERTSGPRFAESLFFLAIHQNNGLLKSELYFLCYFQMPGVGLSVDEISPIQIAFAVDPFPSRQGAEYDHVRIFGGELRHFVIQERQQVILCLNRLRVCPAQIRPIRTKFL